MFLLLLPLKLLGSVAYLLHVSELVSLNVSLSRSLSLANTPHNNKDAGRNSNHNTSRRRKKKNKEIPFNMACEGHRVCGGYTVL